MAALTVRNIPADVHAALKRRATRHGRSAEAEVRALLAQAADDEPVGLGTRIVTIADGLGDELEIPPRDEDFRPLDLP